MSLYPFAEDALFVCWIDNVCLCHRHKVVKQVGVYMNTHIGDKNITRAELEMMAKTWEFDALMKRVGAYVANVMMSPEYWKSEQRKLTSLQECEGCFDSFLTWSYCSLYDPYLHGLYRHPAHAGKLTMAMRAKVKKKVPHLVDKFITARMDSLCEHWLFGCMNARLSWDRPEWQARDEQHRHGLSQHNMPLNHRQNAEIAVEGKLAEILLSAGKYKKGDETKLQKAIKKGQGLEAEAKVIGAVDLLVTVTVTNDHPDIDSLRNVWNLPVPHPCTRTYAEVLRDFNKQQRAEHERDLTNCAGRHTKCNSYCLRNGKCRFHCGDDNYKPLAKSTSVVYIITYPKDKNGNEMMDAIPSIRLRVIFKRNDILMCDINLAMFYSNGFNSDYKIVVDAFRAANYALKYSSKAPKMSATYKQAIVSVLKYVDLPGTSTRSCVVKTILKSHGAIDRGPAEWCHFICGTTTCQIKHRREDGTVGKINFVRVSLRGGKRINMNKTDQEDRERKDTDFVSVDSICDAYARRSSNPIWKKCSRR